MERKEWLRNFSEKLKMLMSKNNLTVGQVAARLDVPDNTVRNWTFAKHIPRADLIEPLAAILGCKVQDLISFKEKH